MYFCEYDSPIGKLLLESDGTNLTGLWMGRTPPADGVLEENMILRKAAGWLDAYFRGEDRPVGFPIKPEGTAFQRKVWEILRTIPYGKTSSYGEIAREMAAFLGKEKMSAQAVGQAVGKNPISILIPCHRVVGTKGQLTGYAGGLEKKVWLLEHEGWNVREDKVL